MKIAGFDARDRQMFGSLLAMIVRDRFLGSQLGRVWVILSPAIMLAIFSFVFTVVFPQRLPGASQSTTYLIWLISGYGPWLALGEGLASGAAAVIGASGIIKNVAFKSELLPLAATLMGLIPLTVAFVFLLVLVAIGGGAINIYWLYLPFVALIQFVLVSGLALYLGATTVFVRDTMMILPNLLLMILFLSPIFFPITSFPPLGQTISYFNPVFVLADSYRQPIINGSPPNLLRLCYLVIVALIVFLSGLRYFRRLKPYFASRL